MPAPSATSGIIDDITRNVGALLRHLLPGLCIVGASYLSHPRWFDVVDVDKWGHLLVLGVISLAAGNVAYVVNRYGLHQLVDFVHFKLRERYRNWCGYLDDVADHTAQALPPEITLEHVRTRAAAVFLLYTICELCLVTLIWHEPKSFVADHRCLVWMLAAGTGAVGLVQDIILDAIDRGLVCSKSEKNHTGSNPTVRSS